MREYLEFEKPLSEIEARIEKLKSRSTEVETTPLEEIKKLEKKAFLLQQEIYAQLTPWQKTQVARHPDRPRTLDYLSILVQDFTELHGDRLFGDDPSTVGGLGQFHQRTVMLIGHQKGKNLKERISRNFGMPHPEGYRKAARLMTMAEKFRFPLITFIDTPGAYPGIGAEERGQSEAIAHNLLIMSQLTIPVVVAVIGEGGSGGALALGVGNHTLMLEHAVYSVISPEGCAAILWNDPGKTAEAATAMRMVAPDLLALGIIDEIVPEPPGGAHRDPQKAAEALGKAIVTQLSQLEGIPGDELCRRRYAKFRRMGIFGEP